MSKSNTLENAEEVYKYFQQELAEQVKIATRKKENIGREIEILEKKKIVLEQDIGKEIAAKKDNFQSWSNSEGLRLSQIMVDLDRREKDLLLKESDINRALDELKINQLLKGDIEKSKTELDIIQINLIEKKKTLDLLKENIQLEAEEAIVRHKAREDALNNRESLISKKEIELNDFTLAKEMFGKEQMEFLKYKEEYTRKNDEVRKEMQSKINDAEKTIEEYTRQSKEIEIEHNRFMRKK